MTDWIERLLIEEGARMRERANRAALDRFRDHLVNAAAAEQLRRRRPVPRRFWYDCEFLEDGRTIELISIGIVADDGREFYMVNADAPWKRIAKHDWLMGNVVPHLPGGQVAARRVRLPKMWLVDLDDPAVQPKPTIAAQVLQFLTGPDTTGRKPGDAGVELWAWYGAYDHVCLAQLWGPMSELPSGVPMWTNDLRQEVARLGNPELPAQPNGLHNALEDARFLKRRWDWLRLYEQQQHGPEILTER